MQPERALFIVLIIVAAVGGAFFFLRAEATRDAALDAELSEAEMAERLAEDERRARGTAARGASGTIALDAALRSRLAELGFSVPDAIPDTDAIIFGRVVTDASTEGEEEAVTAPVGGATIVAKRMGDDGIADDHGENLAVAREDGWFLGTVARSWSWQLEVGGVGYTSETAKVTRADLAQGLHDAGVFKLRKRAGILVTVTTGNASLGEDVRPVEGMEIAVHAGDPESPVATGATDAKGHVTLEGVPTGDLTFAGTLESYAAFEEKKQISQDGQEVAFNVDMVGRLKVRVRTPGGAPLKVFAVALNFQHNTYQYRAPLFTDVTTDDPDGWFVIEGIKAGKQSLYATAQGWAMHHESPVVIKAGETTELSVSLPHGFRVRGRVVAKSSGQPIPGAIVFSERDLIPSTVDTNGREGFSPSARAIKCDAAGNFELEDLTEGVHQLSAMHPEFATKTRRAVKVGKDGVPEVVIKLPLGATLKGHVYDPDGQPLAGGQVFVINIMDAKNMKKKVPLMATTDDEGAYEIKHIPAGFMGIVMSAPRAVASDSAGEYQMKNSTFRDGGVVTIDFGDRSEGAVVQGRVVDGEGKPVLGVTVMLMDASALSGGGIPDFHQGAVDSKGEYRIKGVPEGDYMVQFARTSKGSDFAGTGRLTVPASGVLRKDFTLTGGPVGGIVKSRETGKGVNSGEVTILQNGAFAGHLILGPNGTYEFPFVPAGTYVIAARADEHVTGTAIGVVVEDGVGAEVPPIVLDPGGRIVGEIKDRNGGPVGSARVVLQDAQGKPLPAWAMPSLADGRFSAESVPVGQYEVTAEKAGMVFEAVPATVTKGGSVRVIIREKP